MFFRIFEIRLKGTQMTSKWLVIRGCLWRRGPRADMRRGEVGTGPHCVCLFCHLKFLLCMLVINQKWVKINSEITFFPSPSPPASPEVALLTVWHVFFQILLHVLLYVFVHIHMYEAVCLFCLVLFYINVFIQVILKLVFSPLVICIMSWNFSLIHRSKLSFKAFFKILNFLNRKIKEPFLWEK